MTQIGSVLAGAARAVGQVVAGLFMLCSVVVITGALVWVTAGRLSLVASARNLIEIDLRELVRPYLSTPDPSLLPGAIAGRVFHRVAEPVRSAVSDLSGTLVPDANGSPRAEAVATATPIVREIPVAGATVLIADADANVLEAVTDTKGNYSITGVEPGRYRVVASAAGFAPEIIDRPPGSGPITKLLTWFYPGIDVLTNQASPLDIALERTPSAPSVFLRDLGVAPTPPLRTACAENPDVVGQVSAIEVQSALTNTVQIRRYSPDALDETARTPIIVAVIPRGHEATHCFGFELARQGIEVLVVSVTSGPEIEREVLAVRTLLASLSGASGVSVRPVFLAGAGFAAVHAMRVLQDTLSLDPITNKMEEQPTRRARARLRIRATVLVSPVVDLLVARATATDLLSGSAVLLRSFGPGTREIGRYIRYSARFHLDPATPPIVAFATRSDPEVPFEPLARLARAYRSIGTPFDVRVFESDNLFVDALGSISTIIQQESINPDELRSP